MKIARRDASRVAATVVIRLVHVLAAALVVGGAALLAARASREGARSYEWVFWGSLMALALTGVGNLGALGEVLPAPGSAWGARFAAKLGAVALLVLVSPLRTLLVLRDAPARTLRFAHAATALLAATTLALGVTLAHG